MQRGTGTQKDRPRVFPVPVCSEAGWQGKCCGGWKLVSDAEVCAAGKQWEKARTAQRQLKTCNPTKICAEAGWQGKCCGGWKLALTRKFAPTVSKISQRECLQLLIPVYSWVERGTVPMCSPRKWEQSKRYVPNYSWDVWQKMTGMIFFYYQINDGPSLISMSEFVDRISLRAASSRFILFIEYFV